MLLRSFNGPEPGGPESTIRKWEREKEASISWFMQRTNKTLEQGLHCSWRHRTSSGGGLESPGRFPCSRELDGGREREKERHGDPSLWWSKGVLMIFFVSMYRLLYKEFLSTMIKIRKPNVQQPVSRKQGISNGHKVRRQSISQERESWLSSFVVRRMFTEGNPQMCFISWPHSWEQHDSPLVPVVRNWYGTEDLWETGNSTQESC